MKDKDIDEGYVNIYEVNEILEYKYGFSNMTDKFSEDEFAKL